MSWQGSSYLKDNLTKSALTTGGFLILDKMYNHSPIDLKKGALSFGASYLSEAGSDYFSSMMSNGTMKSAEKTYIQPIVLGGFYILGDMILKWDGRSGWLYPFQQSSSSKLSCSTSFYHKNVVKDNLVDLVELMTD